MTIHCWRIIYQCMALNLPHRVVTENLGVDASTVCQIVQLFKCTGSVSKKEYNKTNLDRKVTDTVQFLYCRNKLMSYHPKTRRFAVSTPVNLLPFSVL